MLFIIFGALAVGYRTFVPNMKEVLTRGKTFMVISAAMLVILVIQIVIAFDSHLVYSGEWTWKKDGMAFIGTTILSLCSLILFVPAIS